MKFEEMKPNLWIQHSNTLRATVIDIDTELNPAFRVCWQAGGQTNWYGPETAAEFEPVSLGRSAADA